MRMGTADPKRLRMWSNDAMNIIPLWRTFRRITRHARTRSPHALEGGDGRDEVLSRWHYTVDGFNTSGQRFLAAVEDRVRARNIPGVRFERVVRRERGALSARREYLRVHRSNLRFDICAAPFGEGFFFSWWFVRLAPRWPRLQATAIAGGVLSFASLSASVAGEETIGTVFLVALLVGTVAAGVIANRGGFGAPEHVASLPWIGAAYRRIFRPVTYFSLDTALLFQEAVSRSVYEAVDATLTDQGLRALHERERRPVLGAALRVRLPGEAR